MGTDPAEKMINCLMKDGARTRARRIVTMALRSVRRRIRDKDPEEVLRTAIQNASPVVEIKRRSVKGATYQVPLPVPQGRQLRLGILGILDRARQMGAGPMWRNLAVAIVAGYRGELPRPDHPKGIARGTAREAFRLV